MRTVVRAVKKDIMRSLAENAFAKMTNRTREEFLKLVPSIQAEENDEFEIRMLRRPFNNKPSAISIWPREAVFPNSCWDNTRKHSKYTKRLPSDIIEPGTRMVYDNIQTPNAFASVWSQRSLTP